MISSYNLASGLEIFKALSSELRVQIYRTVSENEGINLRQLAHELRIPMSTLSPHMQLLRNSELIYLIEQNTPQGKQKCCYLKNRSEQFAITVTTPQNNIRTARSEIPLGCYTDFSVTPTCGLASRTAFIGKLDQPRAFTLMERYQANILWFRTGYLEYVLPNPLPPAAGSNKFPFPSKSVPNLHRPITITLRISASP